MGHHILLVDDTPTVRFKYEVLLRKAGFDVDSANGAHQALSMLDPDHQYDLVITDLKMPDMDGFGLVKEIRDNSRLTLLPVLMLTGSDDEQDLLVNLDAGVSDYLLKSCGVPELLARVRNLVRMKVLQDELTKASQTDALTQLANRRFGVKRLAEEMERARRYGRELSVVIIDIDHFKNVNDTLGHQAGDEVLVSVSSELSNILRKSDCAIRWGGEEFLFVFPETDANEAASIVNRLRAHLEGHPIAVTANEASTVPVTVSGGVAQLGDDDTLETLVDRADQALYRAKETGRNRLAGWVGGEVVPV
ncbi:MAG: two-component system cell cycle response regulator [Pseudohongiellaceae bacterium]|jgi:two-component system cell cycle response regulator